ncbi:hypothetical protein Z043_122117 [Scleropages formosus]|uniref:Uncharacterized protein n=1 Tax=Scleropages formosus TaxID=113540 RepID=A0A0P7UFT0_SCLFO|nr:hypothetical protein Z043_122117 [Scleropages formosus]
MEGRCESALHRRSAGRRGSGLLLQAPVGESEEAILRESLARLTSVTKAITANIRNINESLDRILLDKADVRELETILMQISGKKEEE